MKPDNPTRRALLRARDALIEQVLPHPAITLIDVGRDATSGKAVLRVHVDPTLPAPVLPESINGVDIQMVGGSYSLEEPAA